MNLLFITTQFPYPLDNGGKIGGLNGIRVVEKYYSTTVLSFTEVPGLIDEGLKYFSEILPNVKFIKPVVHDIHIQKNPYKLFSVMFNNYTKNVPYVSIKFENREMYKCIDKCLSEEFYDVIFIDYLNMYIYADYIRKKYKDKFSKLIFKDHNIEYQIFEQESLKSSGIKKIILYLEYKRTKKYEINAIKKSDIVYSVCENNTNHFKEYNCNAFTMLPTVEIETKKRNQNSKLDLLYIGNLSWKPNMSGLQWFIDKVWPLIISKRASSTIDIIGGGIHDNPFSQISGVNFRGYIKDISDIYEKYKIFIVPLFEGSGIRIKILDAFNNDIVVVSTSMACETIGVSSYSELIIADDPFSFSDAILSLLQDESERIRISNNAKSFLMKKYSLKTRQDEFYSTIKLFNLHKSDEQ